MFAVKRGRVTKSQKRDKCN